MSYGLGSAAQTAAYQNILPPMIEPQKIAKPRRCIERLRDEITDWHGSILKS